MKNSVILSLLLGSFISAIQAQPVATYTAQDRWYKHAVIYNLDVKTFQDSDGDGTGDFRGMAERLDYLRALGVDVLWLAPFQPSPLKDDGYDVADYYGIDSTCGTPGDFVFFMRECEKRGIRVMMDVVLNHTSDEHPWFTKARIDTGSMYHQWYAWATRRPENYNKGMAFPGVQQEVWTQDSVTRKWYFHRFYRFQPDLNFSNPFLVEEAERILAYWLKLGISGFRLDAVPFMIEVAQPGNDEPPQLYDLIPRMQRFAQWNRGDAILLGEANVPPADNSKYFGSKGDGLQMMFNFYANQYLFYALATGKTALLKKALTETRPQSEVSQWAYFLRNHDEIDLGRLTDAQRKEVYQAFGPDTSMQLYDRGIRRRLSPMFNNNRQMLDMAYSLLFSLPGTPVIRYGDEIGMGDDLRLQERLAVRTPMQWSDAANAGFTSAAMPFRPVISNDTFGYRKVNVDAQQLQNGSLLQLMKQLIALRKEHPEIGMGNWQLLETNNDNVLAIQYRYNNRTTIAVHNFGRQPVKLSLAAITGNQLQNLLQQQEAIGESKGIWNIGLPAYGYRWFAAVPPSGK